MADDELPEMSPRLAETLELFDILSHTMFAVAPTEIGTVDLHDLPDKVRAVAAERDRLRAVVRRAQEAWTRHVENYGDDDAFNEWTAAWDALRALDVSAGMGDTDAVTPEEMGKPDWYREHYTCPDHGRTGGYESCCECGGWEDGDPNHGRECSEASDG